MIKRTSVKLILAVLNDLIDDLTEEDVEALAHVMLDIMRRLENKEV